MKTMNVKALFILLLSFAMLWSAFAADIRSFTTPNETINGGPQSNGGRLGMTLTADGVDAIKAATRQNFMQGATQIKIMSSGGVVSQFDPWQLDAYSAEEIRAAVNHFWTASRYNTVKAVVLVGAEHDVLERRSIHFRQDLIKMVKL